MKFGMKSGLTRSPFVSAAVGCNCGAESVFDSSGPRIYCVTFVLLPGLSDSCLDELALEYLFPLPLLYNYVRLVHKHTHTHSHQG